MKPITKRRPRALPAKNLTRRAARFAEELEALRTERQQVRNRLERLLGHIDQLGAS